MRSQTVVDPGAVVVIAMHTSVADEAVVALGDVSDLAFGTNWRFEGVVGLLYWLLG